MSYQTEWVKKNEDFYCAIGGFGGCVSTRSWVERRKKGIFFKKEVWYAKRCTETWVSLKPLTVNTYSTRDEAMLACEPDVPVYVRMETEQERHSREKEEMRVAREKSEKIYQEKKLK